MIAITFDLWCLKNNVKTPFLIGLKALIWNGWFQALWGWSGECFFTSISPQWRRGGRKCPKECAKMFVGPKWLNVDLSSIIAHLGKILYFLWRYLEQARPFTNANINFELQNGLSFFVNLMIVKSAPCRGPVLPSVMLMWASFGWFSRTSFFLDRLRVCKNHIQFSLKTTYFWSEYGVVLIIRRITIGLAFMMTRLPNHISAYLCIQYVRLFKGVFL